MDIRKSFLRGQEWMENSLYGQHPSMLDADRYPYYKGFPSPQVIVERHTLWRRSQVYKHIDTPASWECVYTTKKVNRPGRTNAGLYQGDGARRHPNRTGVHGVL